LGSPEPVRDRSPLLRQRNESATGIIGIGLTLEQPQVDALWHEAGGARLVDADGLADRTDSKWSAGLSKGDEQTQLRSPAEVGAEPPLPVVFVFMPTANTAMATSVTVCVVFVSIVLALWGTLIPAAVGMAAATEREVAPSWTAEPGMATEPSRTAWRSESARAAAGAAPPLQARQRLGDPLTGIVRDLIAVSLIAHAPILHVDWHAS
jgi:hypothetical protein